MKLCPNFIQFYLCRMWSARVVSTCECSTIHIELNYHSVFCISSSHRFFFLILHVCDNRTTVFSHSQTVVVCGNCQTVLCQPTGGRARLTEGCSFRRKGDWSKESILLQLLMVFLPNQKLFRVTNYKLSILWLAFLSFLLYGNTNMMVVLITFDSILVMAEVLYFWYYLWMHVLTTLFFNNHALWHFIAVVFGGEQYCNDDETPCGWFHQKFTLFFSFFQICTNYTDQVWGFDPSDVFIIVIFVFLLRMPTEKDFEVLCLIVS